MWSTYRKSGKAALAKNVCGIDGLQQIQLIDAQSLLHTYLEAAIATLVEFMKLIKIARDL